jgi:hypothetical protein
MNYKIRITDENQAIVKRIADENGMNKKGFHFTEFQWYYIIKENEFWTNMLENDYPELTTEQFIAMFDKKETELDKWLRETKAKNLSIQELNMLIENSDEYIYYELKGDSIPEKAEILFNQWNNQTEESPKVEPEWQPKRGDRVLVWNDIFKQNEKIYFEKIGKNYLVMDEYEYQNFALGLCFVLEQYPNMKPLPIEQPTETDFKSKVIELIEKRIEICVESIEEYKNENKFYAAEVWKNCKIENQEILKQIKQL